MSCYLVGDVQGCADVLIRLLADIGFSKGKDDLILLGDVVNRGPSSLTTLRYVQTLGSAVRCLLGNHDLHLLGVASGARPIKAGDTFADVLQASDAPSLLDWIASWDLALQVQGTLLVHAGVLPQWSAQDCLRYAAEVHEPLRSTQAGVRQKFLQRMYGNSPSRWDDALQGMERNRLIVNALTRLRYINAEQEIDLRYKGAIAQAPSNLLPWFEVPDRKTAQTRIAFGHWSALGLKLTPNLAGLDTGCVWGGKLSALELAADGSWGRLQQTPNTEGLALP